MLGRSAVVSPPGGLCFSRGAAREALLDRCGFGCQGSFPGKQCGGFRGWSDLRRVIDSMLWDVMAQLVVA